MSSSDAFHDVNPIAPVDITSTIATRLRELLAQGRFAPGEQLKEASIAKAFNVSRGPVREALKRLTEQGLLHSERNRGVFVPIPEPEDVVDVYRLRGAVESAALRQLVNSPDPEVFAHLWEILYQFRERLAARDWETADELDMSFHRELVYASGSRRLIQAFDTVAVESRMCLRFLTFKHPDHPDMDTWHANILRAVQRGDIAEAIRALEFHNATVLGDLTTTPAQQIASSTAALASASPASSDRHP